MMKKLNYFKRFAIDLNSLDLIIGGNYDTCRAECYGDMAVDCESGPGPEGDAQFDSCMDIGYNWCDGYCGSGV